MHTSHGFSVDTFAAFLYSSEHDNSQNGLAGSLHLECGLVIGKARGRTSVLAVGVRERTLEALETLDALVDVVAVDSLEEANARGLGEGHPLVFVGASAPGTSGAALDALRARLSRGATLVVTGGEDAFELVASLREGFAFRFVSDDAPTDELLDNLKRLIAPRLSARAVLPEGFRVEGRVDGRAFSHAAGDLSNRGLSFLLGAGDLLDGIHPGRTIQSVVLRAPDGRVELSLEEAVVRHGRVQHAHGRPVVRVGVSFKRDDASTAHAVADDRSAATALIRKAIRGGGRFSLQRPGDESAHAFTHAELRASPPALVLTGAVPRTAAHDVFWVSFDLHGTSLSGLTSVIDTDADRLVVSLPQRLHEKHRRHSSRRTPQTPWQATIRSATLGTELQCRVLELHPRGLSVLIAPTDLLPPGLHVDVELLLAGEEKPVRARATVRSIGPNGSAEAEGLRCGLALHDLDSNDAQRLARALIPVGYPGIDAGKPSDFKAIWAFLPEAGLSYHLYADQSALSEHTIEETFGRVLGAGDEVAINLIERHDGRVRGHIAGVRLGQRTWLATHLAANTGQYRNEAQVSRALCLALLEHFEGKQDFEYIKFFWKKALKWPNRVFGWAARGVMHTGLAELREQDLLVRELKGPLPPRPSDVDVSEATPDDHAWLEEFFLSRCGILRVLADDLTRDGFALPAVATAYARAGLSRTRRLRIARRGGKRLGVSAIELSTQGLQLNEFTSHVEVFAVEPSAASLDIRRALVADALEVYQGAGRRHAIALCEDADTSPFLDAGFVSQTPFRSLTLHRSLVRSYSDLLALLFQTRGFEDVSDS